MTDDLAFLDRHDDGRLPNGAKGRPKCRRHEWANTVVTVEVTAIEGRPRVIIEEPASGPEYEGPLPDAGTSIVIRRCARCGKPQDATTRRGRTSLRAGKDAERAIARAYGGTRTGQYGGPDDVVIGDVFVVQSKAGGWFSERVWAELAKLPRAGGRIPTLIVSDRPGPGHRTRRYVVRMMDDDLDLHGPGR